MIHHHKCPAVVTTLISLIFLTHFQIFLRWAARCCCPGLRNQTVLVLGADSGAGRCPPGPPLDVGEGGDLTADFRTHRGFLRHIPLCFIFFCHHMRWNNTYVHQISKIECPQWLGTDSVLQRPSLATIEPQNRFVIADYRGRVGAGVSPLSVRSKTPHHRTGPDTRH